MLLKATPPKKSVRSPGLLDNATVGGAEQWIKGGDSESEEESPVLLPPRQQDRAGEPADRSRDMLKLVRPCRPSLASTCRERGKRKEHPLSPGSPVRSRPAPPGQGTANGRGFAVRGTSGRSIRPCFPHRTPSAAVWSIPPRGYCSSFLINYFRQKVVLKICRKRAKIALDRGDRLWAASSASGGALNSAIWYALVCTTQSRSRQLKLDSPIGPKLWT